MSEGDIIELPGAGKLEGDSVVGSKPIYQISLFVFFAGPSTLILLGVS